jgi:membrane-bound lytic murein transglycosylase B
MPGLLIAGLLGVALSSGALLVPTGDPADPADPAAPSARTGSAAPTAPPDAGLPLSSPGSVPTGQANPAEALTGWSEQMSTRTGVPVVALRAYGYAELAVTATTPGCRLSWTTLAAIGRVESNHGSSGGATLLADGRALPPILGPVLDGTGDTARISDTDGGRLDRDPSYDRAVGPMQFIPSTWQLEAVDATGDGVGDVHNIHDAALAAANYLCRGGRDLTTADGWWGAVLSYNRVQVYAEAVFAAANEYGRQSRGAGG